MALLHPSEKSDLVQILEGLVNRLSASDLTAAESAELRARLFRLLEAIEADKSSRRIPSSVDRRTARGTERFAVV